nr:hypothetical protein BaRGS_026051 [Batillaria attramentaria]
MGNSAVTRAARESLTYRSESHPYNTDAVCVKVAGHYLRCESHGVPVLVEEMETQKLDPRCLFLFDKHEEMDIVDGKTDELFTMSLQASRCSKPYYLCAREDRRTEDATETRNSHRSCVTSIGKRYRVRFDTSSGEDPEAVWRLTETSEGEYVIRPWCYPDVCVAEVDGQLCLEPYNLTKRNNRVTVLPLINEM